MNTLPMILAAGTIAVLSPGVLLVGIGLPGLFGMRVGERLIARMTQTCVTTGLAASSVVLGLMWYFQEYRVPLEIGNWVHLEEEHFHFEIKFIFDRLSLPFLLMSYLLCGVIGAFASRYLHRDEGYYRFFVFFSMFFCGMVLSSVAGTIETLFFGWELVGLSSALLVAFFQNRKNPVYNGQRVWSIYRLSDGAFLLAALAMHHLTETGDFEVLMGTGPWPQGQAELPASHALLIGLLLLVAAAGKSALIPFSGWLPRAMEGPTPSSAVFYGALSVHLGAFLLLRVSPLIELSGYLQAAVILLGLSTAVYAAVVARVQTDVKSSLAFASLTQVSIIVVEIGCGLRYLVLCHIIGHVCLRTLQLLRAPSILKDHRATHDAIGESPGLQRVSEAQSQPGVASRKKTWEQWLYRFAAERGGFDTLFDDYIVQPFLAIFRWSSHWESRWTAYLSGELDQGTKKEQRDESC